MRVAIVSISENFLMLHKLPKNVTLKFIGYLKPYLEDNVYFTGIQDVENLELHWRRIGIMELKEAKKLVDDRPIFKQIIIRLGNDVLYDSDSLANRFSRELSIIK
jgi:hypothetical protein